MTNSFSTLGLAEPLLLALQQQDYRQPTPIQAQAIPHLLAGRDMLGIAQTGTGKTAAFALPMLQRLAAAPAPYRRNAMRALILTPTRELAIQIADAVRAYGRQLHLRTTVIVGGVNQRPQAEALARGLDIVIATPGRLLDLIDQGHARLDGVEMLVLDEADRMLDLGFIHPIRKIAAKLPKARQSLLFSATMPHDVEHLAQSLLRDPVRVEVTPAATTVDRVEQRVMFVAANDKRAALTDLLRDASIERALVFTRTKHGADRVAQHLERGGLRAGTIHGNKSQNARQRALGDFRDGRTRVLVATDIAARGIDIDGITHVVNFELPNVPESYVHRIGRTARAGAAGVAISFCDASERPFLRDIEKLTRQKLTVFGDVPDGAAPANDQPRPQAKPKHRFNHRPRRAA
ncbi:MAG TPA: DEAD/DEAH box helicase [Stellaceae bacterium]|nr:DEAD/DEAH box helicase [Stellaceae bacterium]